MFKLSPRTEPLFTVSTDAKFRERVLSVLERNLLRKVLQICKILLPKVFLANICIEHNFRRARLKFAIRISDFELYFANFFWTRLGRAESAEPALGGVQQQGRGGGVGATGGQPRSHPHLQDTVQHLLHPRHLGDGHR